MNQVESLRGELQSGLRLPVICAPMFKVSGPDLITAACCAGIIGALPRSNVDSLNALEAWLSNIRERVDRFRFLAPNAPVGPIAVNLSTRLGPNDLNAHLDVCARYGVRIITTALGDPSPIVPAAHSKDLLVFHDVTTYRHAEKAIAAGVDGLICIGSGGGGHSGLISPFAFIPRIRRMFDGIVVLAGAVAEGSAVRAAIVLGADLCYIGTRFIASTEAMAPEAYKRMLVEQGLDGLRYTAAINGVAANWLAKSLEQHGLDPDALPQPVPGNRHAHLPQGARPWTTLWSAGQGIDLIEDVPSVQEIVERLAAEYAEAAQR